jgi:hypothetical protein
VTEEDAAAARKRTSLHQVVRSAAPPAAAEDVPEQRLSMEQRRGKIVLEIFLSEKIYCDLLKEFRTDFLIVLERMEKPITNDFLNRPKLAGIYANIEQIEHLSNQLISEMRAEFARCGVDVSRIHEGKSVADAKAASKVKVGHIFDSIASLLPLYEQYVENHAFAKSDINEFVVSSDFQKKWWDAHAMSKPGLSDKDARKRTKTHTQRTHFQGYLILPIQRVPRYVLLLKELQTTTAQIGASEGADGEKVFNAALQDVYAIELKDVKSALKLVTKVASSMNETIRKSESHQTMENLQRKLTNTNGEVDLLLNSSVRDQRFLVMEVGDGRAARLAVRADVGA